MSILKINNLSVNKGKKTILSNLNIDIDYKKFISIIGHKGAGKTSLMLSIFDLLPDEMSVTSGDILYQEKSLYSSSTENEYRGKKISVVFSDAKVIFNNNYRVEKQIIHMLISQKIYKNKNKIKEKLGVYAQKLDLDISLLKEYPQSIDDKNIKKIGLILAIMFNPEILIIDDSFQGLDSITIKIFGLFLKELKKQMTIIYLSSMITSYIEISDSIYYINEGKTEKLDKNELEEKIY